MTREEIIKEYKIDWETGRIMSPGKFEGEMLYAPYFYEQICEGHTDDVTESLTGRIVDIFYIGKDDLIEFEELQGVKILYCHEDDNGFFHIEEELND